MSSFWILVSLILCSIALNIYTYFLGKDERDFYAFHMKRLEEKFEALYRKSILEFTHLKNRIKALELRKSGRPKKNEK